MTKNNTTTAPRKTAKFYRDLLSGCDVYKAISVLPEVIKKYGSKRWSSSKSNDILYLKDLTEFEWNHQIVSFFLSDKGVLCVDIYWQGDSTDGNDSLTAREAMYGKVIPAEHEFLGDRTYYRHGDLRISSEEFRNAVKAVATYLSPKETKERNQRRKREENNSEVFKYLDAKKKSMDRWEMENFWNGRIAVQRLLEKEPALLDKPFEELKPIVEKVYKNNCKSDYSLRGGWYNGEKKYNLSY